MGRYGRNVSLRTPSVAGPDTDMSQLYYKRWELWDGTVPAHTPTNLLTDDERSANSEADRILWIRTWYGDELTDRATADASYRRLHRRAFLQDDRNPNETFVDGLLVDSSFVFDEEASDFGSNGPVQVGTTPDFVLRALTHCPDQLDGASMRSWRSDDEAAIAAIENDLEKEQVLLVLVADREACEDGWVLQVALNHQARVLPMRLRSKADRLIMEVSCWQTGADPIDVVNSSKSVEMYVGHGSGWDYD